MEVEMLGDSTGQNLEDSHLQEQRDCGAHSTFDYILLQQMSFQIGLVGELPILNGLLEKLHDHYYYLEMICFVPLC